MQLGKNFLQDKTYNYYDKYFNEERVIFLYKAFNNNFNINSNELKNCKYYYNTRLKNFDKNNFSNVNIITNNFIQNNIIIINGINSNENKENINSSNYCTNT